MIILNFELSRQEPRQTNTRTDDRGMIPCTVYIEVWVNLATTEISSANLSLGEKLHMPFAQIILVKIKETSW